MLVLYFDPNLCQIFPYPPRSPNTLLLRWIVIRRPAWLKVTNISSYAIKNRSYFSRYLLKIGVKSGHRLGRASLGCLEPASPPRAFGVRPGPPGKDEVGGPRDRRTWGGRSRRERLRDDHREPLTDYGVL